MKFTTDTIEKAYAQMGRTNFEMPAIPALSSEETTYMKQEFDLRMVIDAINQEANGGKPWIADYTDYSQEKWEILYYMKKDNSDPAGFVFSDTYYAYTNTYTVSGARFCFINREAAKFCFESFTSLHFAVKIRQK